MKVVFFVCLFVCHDRWLAFCLLVKQMEVTNDMQMLLPVLVCVFNNGRLFVCWCCRWNKLVMLPVMACLSVCHQKWQALCWCCRWNKLVMWPVMAFVLVCVINNDRPFVCWCCRLNWPVMLPVMVGVLVCVINSDRSFVLQVELTSDVPSKCLHLLVCIIKNDRLFAGVVGETN